MTVPVSVPVFAESSGPADTIRVVKGAPTEEELAALAVVLLARSAAQEPVQPGLPHRPSARWRRPDRVHGHRVPRSWRAEPRPVDAAAGAHG
ncbi:acyl-CoA carboxylase subunit epsilon (plasmid) [Streptomyces sp. NBC_01384]|uniref:acyl-CoA carboxylase epsilon subunit n=1 Tax=Streptomyces sp. NBC_01384 TaxID=2903847 RepID=UPI002F90FC03